MNKRTVVIGGMTCGNCVKKVTAGLSANVNVKAVDIHLAPANSLIESSDHLSDKEINSLLGQIGDYRIISQIQKSSWIKTYKPLLILVSILLITSITLTLSFGKGMIFGMHCFMGGFFISFAFLKFLDINGFVDSYSSYDLLAKKINAYGFIYPFLEFGLGLAYINFWAPQWTYISSFILMVFSSIGVIQAVRKKQEIKCACMGTMFDLPMSTITIVEDLVMAIMAAILLFLTF